MISRGPKVSESLLRFSQYFDPQRIRLQKPPVFLNCLDDRRMSRPERTRSAGRTSGSVVSDGRYGGSCFQWRVQLSPASICAPCLIPLFLHQRHCFRFRFLQPFLQLRRFPAVYAKALRPGRLEPAKQIDASGGCCTFPETFRNPLVSNGSQGYNPEEGQEQR